MMQDVPVPERFGNAGGDARVHAEEHHDGSSQAKLDARPLPLFGRPRLGRRARLSAAPN
jgi:hypothetical protein